MADSMAPGSDDKKALDAPSVSLSKGGGVIRGIGEKFAANPVTGNGSLYSRRDEPRTLRIRTRAFMVVRFRLRNGPFGFGWSLALPAITRKTDKGLPRYRDAEESAPGTPQLFTYNAHGNTTGIPHLTSMAWDFKDDCPSTGASVWTSRRTTRMPERGCPAQVARDRQQALTRSQAPRGGLEGSRTGGVAHEARHDPPLHHAAARPRPVVEE